MRRSEVFAGNVSEGQTLAGMLEGLHAPAGDLIVMDRGIATEVNLVGLRARGYRYLVVSRERSRQFDPEHATTLINASGERLHLEKTRTEEGHEVKLCCYSEQRADKETGIQRLFTQRFERGTGKDSQHYTIEPIPDATGTQAAARRYQQDPVAGSALTHPGVYCLRSSETDWDPETQWLIRSMLTDSEAVFHSLKSEQGLPPIFHDKQGGKDRRPSVRYRADLPVPPGPAPALEGATFSRRPGTRCVNGSPARRA